MSPHERRLSRFASVLDSMADDAAILRVAYQVKPSARKLIFAASVPVWRDMHGITLIDKK